MEGPHPSALAIRKVVASANPAANAELSVTVPSNVVASGNLTWDNGGVNFADGDTVQIGTVTYTFRASLIAGVPYEVLRGADGDAALANLKACINHAAGAGTTYNATTPKHLDAAGGTIANHILPVTARNAGAEGNLIATVATSAHASFGAVTLTGGVTEKWWELVSVSVALVQGITQTPQPFLVIDDGTSVIYESLGSSAAQDVSTTCRYTWAPGLTISGQVGATTNVHSVAPLPAGLIIGPGYKVTTTTIGKGAATDYGVASLYVTEFN